VLTVHAERGRPDLDGVELIVAERPQGSFSRHLFLGESLDTAEIQAEYNDGVLTIRIPVAETAKPRKVKIATTGSEPAAISAA